VGYRSTDEVSFRGTVARWIAERGEVSALEFIISAVVPDRDGSVLTGVY